MLVKPNEIVPSSSSLSLLSLLLLLLLLLSLLLSLGSGELTGWSEFFPSLCFSSPSFSSPGLLSSGMPSSCEFARYRSFSRRIKDKRSIYCGKEVSLPVHSGASGRKARQRSTIGKENCNPSSRENLVMTTPYERPSSAQTLGEGEGRLNVNCDFGCSPLEVTLTSKLG